MNIFEKLTSIKKVLKALYEKGAFDENTAMTTLDIGQYLNTKMDEQKDLDRAADKLFSPELRVLDRTDAVIMSERRWKYWIRDREEAIKRMKL